VTSLLAGAAPRRDSPLVSEARRAASRNQEEEKESEMRSLHRVMVMAGTIVALIALVPSVSAASPAFHLEKVCDTATHCVVTSSSFKAIPAGTEITYSGPDANHLTAVITVKNGTATGHCAIGSLVGYGDPSLPARCTFNRGTGRLAQFHLIVKVTTTAQFNPWYWDGWYWFGGGH
jgi:hypothetical protein